MTTSITQRHIEIDIAASTSTVELIQAIEKLRSMYPAANLQAVSAWFFEEVNKASAS
jgi:hypothetical protein